MNRLLSPLLLVLLLFAPGLCAPVLAADGSALPASRPGQAAVASAHQLATDAGFEVLDKGGNAFDAAVAVSAALSVVEPISSGLGGGGFFLLHQADNGRDVFIDAREAAPAAASTDRYRTADGKLDASLAQDGAWAAGIPGLPAALVHVAGKYGRLPLSESLAPAIRLARDGFPVYPRLERGYAARREVMERFPGTRAVFLANGGPPQAGQQLQQPDLAGTLELLARQGFDGFYRGPVADKLVAGVRAEGGQWTAAELAAYQVREREPLRFRYRGWEVVTAPPPSSGGVALAQMMQILSGWDLAGLDPALRAHLTIESMRRAFRDRTFYLGDPDFVHVPVDVLTSPYYAAGLRSTINPDKATPSGMLPGNAVPLEDEETTHFSIIDADGNRAAVTQTVNLLFGSGLIPPGTGVMLNNEMDDFALVPGQPNAFGVMGFEANAPAPGKRPLSSMTPTFMVSPDKVAVLGTPGGSRIITMVLLGALGFADGLDAQQAAALPRYHHQWWPDVVGAENGAFTAEVATRLRAMGHTLDLPGDGVSGRASSHVWGNMQTVLWKRRDNVLEAGTDPRNPVGSGRVERIAAGSPKPAVTASP